MNDVPVSVKRVHRSHRRRRHISLKSRRIHPSTTDVRVIRVIQTTIPSSSPTRPANNKTIDRNDNIHLISRHDQNESKSTSSTRSLDESSKNSMRFVSVTSPDRLLSQSHKNEWKNDHLEQKFEQQNEFSKRSQEVVNNHRERNHGTFSMVKEILPTTGKQIHTQDSISMIDQNGIIKTDHTDCTKESKLNSKTKKKQRYFGRRWCRCSCLCKLLCLLFAFLLATGIAAILVAFLTKSIQRTTTTTTTTATTTTTTTTAAVCNPSCLNGGTCSALNTCQCITDVWTGPICQTPVRILWTFDNNLDDFYNNFPGVAVNGPTYSSPGINDYGSCIYLNGTSSQSIIVYSPPFLNMAQTSFSLVGWVKAASFHNGSNASFVDNAIFGQFQSNTKDQSLHIVVRNQRIYLGFFNDDTQGNRTLYPNNWYHMAYVYDYSTLTQFVYVNGVLDVSSNPKGPYQGTTGNLTIGNNGVNTPYNYWGGCLDQVAYFARAKNATEVLRDATLTVAYTFNNTLLDNGPLGINGTGSNYSYDTSGRVNQCVTLLINPSYIQATGLVLLGTTSQAYSLAIWIQPTVITSGTIIHASALTNGFGWCIPMLGFTNAGFIGVQGWNGSSVSIVGPAVSVNVWTHLAVTYGLSNGLRLWVNGTHYGASSGAYNYIAANVSLTVTLGSSLNATGYCVSGDIASGQFYGNMDEFQLYSRELNASDIFSLANP